MADPFSIIATAISVADVLVRLSLYLKAVCADAATIENDIRDLTSEVEALEEIVTSIQKAFVTEISTPPSSGAENAPDSVENLWQRVGKSLKTCLAGVRILETVIGDICGKSGRPVTNAVDGLVKAHRKRSKADSIRQCRDQLSTYQRNLNLLLTTINLYDAASMLFQTSDNVAGRIAETHRKRTLRLLDVFQSIFRISIVAFVPKLRFCRRPSQFLGAMKPSWI
jgi:hypothetical protein